MPTPRPGTSSASAAKPWTGPSSVVLASNLLYLTPDQRAELNNRLFDLLRDYELEDPDHVPAGAERMATMWSMIPDDRGRARCEHCRHPSRNPRLTASRPRGARPAKGLELRAFITSESRVRRPAFSCGMRGNPQNMVN